MRTRKQMDAYAEAATCGGPPTDGKARALGLRVPEWMAHGSLFRGIIEWSLLGWLIVLLGVEIVGIVQGGPTISAITRRFNATSGGLLALILAAIWLHIFCVVPSVWSSPTLVDQLNCQT